MACGLRCSVSSAISFGESPWLAHQIRLLPVHAVPASSIGTAAGKASKIFPRLAGSVAATSPPVFTTLILPDPHHGSSDSTRPRSISIIATTCTSVRNADSRLDSLYESADLAVIRSLRGLAQFLLLRLTEELGTPIDQERPRTFQEAVNCTGLAAHVDLRSCRGRRPWPKCFFLWDSG